MKIFILSCLAYAEGNEDLRNLSRAFSENGASCEIVPWQILDVGSLDEDSLILPLAAWDYSLDATKFLSFLGELEKSGAKIINGAEIVRWNLSKKYLLELEALGLPAIPSTLLSGDENIEELRRICPGGVIKPLVGQSGNGVAKIDEISNLSEYKNGALLQPFIEEIAVSGEICLIFLGGVFSHAVRRSPASDDYRANSNFGVKISSVEPTAAFLNIARDVLARLAFNPVYARIDLIGAKDKILINEVELIEPSLYFSYGKNSTEKFVKIILDKFVAEKKI
ncbi:hypothetical protein [uncultured Campylobacter sp.]|uniref:ATP-grasp domain-containing protein n=1 Tax=uncultured Campylobacter sp. TaxID=218934 RepID=UPI0028E7BFD3|nr:hypothetical protein [uncultured Campylobacter sp.]